MPGVGKRASLGGLYTEYSGHESSVTPRAKVLISFGTWRINAAFQLPERASELTIARLQTRMRGFLALVIALAGPGNSISVAQSGSLPVPSLQATSPLQAGSTGAGLSQNASPNLGLANPTPCSPNQSTVMLPTFDGGGLNVGSTATPSSGGLSLGSTGTPSLTVAQGSTVGLMGAAAGTSAPCSAANGSSATSAATATASSPNTSSLGTTGLGTSGLGTTALGMAGLVSSSAGSTSTLQTTPTLAGSAGSAFVCATGSDAMSGSAGDQIGQGASGTVADPAESLADTIPSPAQALSGSASLPDLAPSCANTP